MAVTDTNVKLSRELYDWLRDIAADDRRTLKGELEQICTQWAAEHGRD
jgi:hypothetical protein